MADPTFSGDKKTSNGSFNPSLDHKTPALGLLNLGAMPALSALSGTLGIDVKLIHGDRWQQIEGNETDFIIKNLARTVDGDEKRLLVGDLDTTVIGRTKDDRFDLFLGNFYEASTFNYFHHRLENHTAEEQEHQPTAHREVIEKEEKKKENSFESTWHKEEVVGFSAGFTATKLEGLGVATEGFGAKAGMGGIEATGIGWKNKAEALETRLNAFAAKCTGAEVESGGPDTAIRPVFVGILVAVHIDSPFA